MRTSTKLAALAAMACLVAGVAAATAGAIVPPRNCGIHRVEGKRYQIKADQMRCSTAITYSRRFLADGRRPSGYRCRNYTSATKLKFRCYRGIRVFFAIRR